MFRLLKFGVKAGLASSAVYYTVDIGVWNDSETTTALYNQLEDKARPYVKPYWDQVPKLPQTADLTSSVKTAWNKGVLASFLFLCATPDIACDFIRTSLTWVGDKIQESIDNMPKDSVAIGN